MNARYLSPHLDTLYSFPAPTNPWERIQVSNEEVAERAQAFQRSDAHPTPPYQTDPSLRSPSIAPPHPFRTQPKARDFKAAMRDEKYKWWNAPPKTDPKSKLEASKSGKLELHVPSVEGLTIEPPFLSPSLDGLRSFRGRPHPWDQNTSTYTMAERDRLFKRYNGRPQKPVRAYEAHCLDHSTMAKQPGEPEPHVVSIEGYGEEGWKIRFLELYLWTRFQSWVGNWIGVLVIVVGSLFFGMEPIIKPVLIFTSRWVGWAVAPVIALWFIALLSWPIY